MIMSSRRNVEGFRIREQNISYYNQIAAKYNSILEQEDANQIARRTVAEKFKRLVKTGTVLDFGGGTGLDLEWMARQNYSVIFCEPSIEMRKLAININKDSLRYNNITFLDERQVDYTKWCDETAFFQRFDGALANFAVLNCIPDLGILFENLARVIKPGGHMLALMLDNGMKKLLRSHIYRTFRYLLFREPVTIQVRFNEHTQIVYIHTTKEIRIASGTYFSFCKREPLPGTGFILIHLIRK
jgi:SAM-dependent methyltransferase